MQLVQAQQFKKADTLCTKICKKNPNDAEAWFMLGAINGQLGDFKKAETCCRRAIKLQPNHAGLHYNLAIALAKQNKLDKSLISFKQTILLNPQHVEAYLDLGNTLRSLGHLEQAINNYQQAIRLQPTLQAAHYNLGEIYRSQNRLADAETCYVHTLKIQPDYADACRGLANIYMAQTKYTEAAKLLDPVVEELSDGADLTIKLAVELMLQGEHEQSLTCLQKIISLYPDHVEARWAYTILQIPSIYATIDMPVACRTAFSNELTQLENWFKENKPERDYLSVGNQHPFFLAYQEHNNRKLLARHGNLLCQYMSQWFTKQHFSFPEKIEHKKSRIGIISPHLLDHSVWDAIVKGWYLHLDKKLFELYTFHISNIEDNETKLAKEHSSFYIHGDKNIQQWTEIIINQQIDILIYPEIGMDPMTVKLACLRLAPVQVAAWGHPETTGLPTIDYYLSAEDLEPVNAQNFYTEQLIPLPHLGCYYQPLSLVPAEPDWVNIHIDQNIPILLCPGMPFKYAPEYDWIFIEIARELGECQFVFFQHNSLGKLPEKFYNRLRSVFKNANLEFNDYVKLIPWQKKTEFFGLMQQATLFMDTIGFSGFNTAMQAIECGLPIVTREGKFMRGRLASGILRRSGLTELIAGNEKEYITLIVKIAKNPEYRHCLQKFIEKNSSILFNDLIPIRAMERYFLDIVKVNN